MKPTFNPVTKFHVSFFNTYLQDLRHFATLYRDRFFAMDSSEYELNKAALFKRRYGLDIISKHRCQKTIIISGQKVQTIPKRKEPQPSNSSFATAPTFGEFVSYLLATDVAEYNSHWVPVHLLCRPCSLQYTIVAKTETIETDSRWRLFDKQRQ